MSNLEIKKWINPKNQEVRYYINSEDYNLDIITEFFLNEKFEIVMSKHIDAEATNLKYTYDTFFKERGLEMPKNVGEAIKIITNEALSSKNKIK